MNGKRMGSILLAAADRPDVAPLRGLLVTSRVGELGPGHAWSRNASTLPAEPAISDALDQRRAECGTQDLPVVRVGPRELTRSRRSWRTPRGRASMRPIVDPVEGTDDDLVRTPPTLEDYLHLRAASGLTPKSSAQGEGALVGSWCWSVIRRGGQAVAMGRVIGDGGWYFHIADVATLPEHQGRGLGRRVLTDLLAQIDEAAPAGPYVTLMADAPGRRLYESMGFVETAPRSLGMRLGN